VPPHLLQQVLFADQPQLLAMGVVGERLHHVGAGVHELAVKLRHLLGMVEHHLRHEAAGLQVAAPLQLEQVASAQITGPSASRSISSDIWSSSA
jgi:hypothetical protein